VKGLTTNTSPGGAIVVYSESSDNIFKTKVWDREVRESYDLPITTLPEKCAWSNLDTTVIYCGVPKGIERGTYPDLWYQGVASFSDSLWRVDIDTRVSEQIIDPFPLARADMDIINLMISENDKYLIFTNKKDSTLWSLELAEK